MQIKYFSFKELQNSVFHEFVNNDVMNTIHTESERSSILILQKENTDVYTAKQGSITISHENDEIKVLLSKSNTEEVPFVIVLTNSNDNYFSINMDDNSCAELLIVQNLTGEASLKHTINVGKNAQLKSMWSLIKGHTSSSLNAEDRQEAKNIYRQVVLSEKALFDDHQVFTPQSTLNLFSNIKMIGKNAHAISSGCIMSDKGEFFYEPIQEHFSPSAKSELNFNVVLSKRAKSFFRGLVILHKEAQHSEAYQQNKNLLLSRSARADAEPRLEIIPNDVMCKHGSATAELDKKQIYYLMSRGFSFAQSKNMIIQSFCNTAIVNREDSLRPFENIKQRLREHYLKTQVEILNS